MSREHEFGSLLKSLRVRAGMKQEDLAGKVNVRRATISDWESGNHLPKHRDDVVRLADALDCSEEDLQQLLAAAAMPRLQPREEHQPSTVQDEDGGAAPARPTRPTPWIAALGIGGIIVICVVACIMGVRALQGQLGERLGAILSPTDGTEEAPTLPPSVSPTARPAGAPGPVVREDFDEALSGDWEILEGRPLIAGGRLVEAGEPGSAHTLFGVIGQPEWQDYEVAVDFYLPDGLQDDAVAIVARYQDADNFVAFYSASEIYSHWAAWYVVEGGQWREVSGTRQTIPLYLRTVSYSIRVQDNTYTGSIAGEVVSSFTDAVFPAGRVGFWLRDDPGAANSQPLGVDGFTVRLLP